MGFSSLLIWNPPASHELLSDGQEAFARHGNALRKKSLPDRIVKSICSAASPSGAGLLS
jgi:hypothetical protein